MTFTVNAAVGVVVHLNVNVPDACAEQYTPALQYASWEAGAGVTTTELLAVTPVTETVCARLDHDATGSDTETVLCFASAPMLAGVIPNCVLAS